MKPVMGSLITDYHKYVPGFVRDALRTFKKANKRRQLAREQQKGQSLTTRQLADQLRDMGINSGDHLMVHSALSKMGHVEDGAMGVVQALLQVVGPTGTVCMPSSPVSKLQLDYLKEDPVFDVRHTPSAMGTISEAFRKLPDTKRSLHPTEPVCANGRLAVEFVKDHFGQPTPYNAHSPWKKLMDAKGKILYVGVTLANAGTHLHTLEDAVNFKYPVYYHTDFTARLIDENGQEKTMQTKVHNPDFSRRRRCDELLPLFMQADVLQKTTLGRADCLLLDAEKMFTTMLRAYHKKGVTMYTPGGETIAGYDE
jgi:aminoglycoside 3-N-acetyltransferase